MNHVRINGQRNIRSSSEFFRLSDREAFSKRCRRIAEAMNGLGNGHDNHWDQTARQMLAGIVAHVVTTGEDKDKILGDRTISPIALGVRQLRIRGLLTE